VNPNVGVFVAGLRDLATLRRAVQNPNSKVVIEPQAGRFLVRDPLPDVSYSVAPSWVERFVAGGTFER